MNNKHLGQALRVTSNFVGLAESLTSRVFRHSYAFKVILEGNIPGWRITSCMGHFSGNKDLSCKVYAPTQGPEDTQQTSGPNNDQHSANVSKALKANGAMILLPDPANIEPQLLSHACSLLETFNQQLDEQMDGSTDKVPACTLDKIRATFQTINNRTKAPFKELLAGLLSVTGTHPAAMSSIAEYCCQAHSQVSQDCQWRIRPAISLAIFQPLATAMLSSQLHVLLSLPNSNTCCAWTLIGIAS